MADISIEVNGVKFPNPYVIGSGPPSTNFRTIDKAFTAGWGGVVAKTVSLSSTPVMNVNPRYGKLKTPNGDIIGFENIELISDRTLEVWLDEFKRIKDKHPDKVLIASLMESYEKNRWQDLTGLIAETGVDMFELNFSCPHGHPESGMGAFMGQNKSMVEEVTGWVREVTTLPIWAKMTPDITDITAPAKGAFDGGADGVAAINTIPSIVGINLENLRPIPTVEGYSTPGGFSYYAVKPLALRKVSEIARALKGRDISGIGGVISSQEAIEFILMGSSTVQVCTGVMLQGYGMIEELNQGLSDFMDKNGFKTVREFVGHSLQYLTTHHHLVDLKIARKANALGTNRDENWGKDITKETDNLASN
jgi:dihydropyrimidine dehydrogenase (NADP+)